MPSLKSIVSALAVMSACVDVSGAEPVGSPVDDYVVVEMTHVLNEDFPFIPVPGVTFPFSRTPIATIEEMGVAANAWRMHEHLGTQIDAPNHFISGAMGLDALEAGQLIVPVVVIDFRRASRENTDAALTTADILAWEREHGRIPAGAVVALYTGWDRLVATDRFIGLDERGVKHFPGFSAEAVTFLVDERAVWGVATDTISFDPGPDGRYGAHRALLERSGWALEAVNNLDALPAAGAWLFIGAPLVEGATGGPARVLGLAPRSRAPRLEGTWSSRSPESLGRGGFLTRDFIFDGSRWSLTYTVYEDEAATRPLVRGEVGGWYEIQEAPGLTGAYPTRFHFERRRLAPMSDAAAQQMRAAGCTGREVAVGDFIDVTEEGCAGFRVPALAECSVEHDLVRRAGGILYLGARTNGPLCGASNRAETATAPPLIRR